MQKLAAIFQQVLPGMFQESGTEEILIPQKQDRDGNLYWPCFYCKNPIRDEEGFYVSDKDDLENFERYMQYEETLSNEDTLSAEKLEEARTASDHFYNEAKLLTEEIIRITSSLSDEEFTDALVDYDSELRNKLARFGIIFRDMIGKIRFIFDKHYYYNDPDVYAKLSEIRESLSERHGSWPYYSWYHSSKEKTYERVKEILNEAAEKYKLIRDAISIASQSAGTKKHLIQRHIINHPICDECIGKYGIECYAPNCNFTSRDISDFHKVDINIFDNNTNKRYTEEKLFCDEHAFKCNGCGREFIKNPAELFGTTSDEYGYGAQGAFGDLYCDNCFSESFDYCEECNQVFPREDLLFDEKSQRNICQRCMGGAERQDGVDYNLNSDEKLIAAHFAENPFGVGDAGFFPIDTKAITTQILPALNKSMSKKFNNIDDLKAWLLMRIQSKDAKAAITASLPIVTDEEFKTTQEQIILHLIESFSNEAQEITNMAEKYPELRGYKPLDVFVKLTKTPGHDGHAFAIYPTERLLDYADSVMPGARAVYDRFLKHKGHHPGALAYARFSKSDGNIIIDNLQTDLDSQALKYELRNAKESKQLQWWLSAIKKFWAPYMLNLLHQYGENANKKVYLTSYKMQKTKWKTLPERNLDIYERIPEMMGFKRERVSAKPEDLTRKEYKMRRIASFVDIFYKLAQIQ